MPFTTRTCPSSGFIVVSPCSVKVVFTGFFTHQVKTQFAQLGFSWGSLSVRVASTHHRLSSLLTLALVLTLFLALPRPVLAQVLALALSLALSRLILPLLFSFGR